MFCATITITDNTQKPRNLLDLLQNGSGKGYTVKTGVAWSSLNTLGQVSYVSIQASNLNSSATVYEGDENVLTNGTLQGKELLGGDVDVHQAFPNSTFLAEIYLTASANGAIINVQTSYS